MKALKEDRLLVEQMFDYNNKIFVKVVFRAIITSPYVNNSHKIVVPYTHNLISEENLDQSRDFRDILPNHDKILELFQDKP